MNPILLELRQLKLDWGLSEEQLARIVHASPADVAAWLRGEVMDPHASVPRGMENVPPLLSIRRKLASKLPDPEDQAKWLLKPHRDFGNQPPLDVAASSSENLAWIAYFLDSALRAQDAQAGEETA